MKNKIKKLFGFCRKCFASLSIKTKLIISAAAFLIFFVFVSVFSFMAFNGEKKLKTITGFSSDMANGNIQEQIDSCLNLKSVSIDTENGTLTLNLACKEAWPFVRKGAYIFKRIREHNIRARSFEAIYDDIKAIVIENKENEMSVDEAIGYRPYFSKLDIRYFDKNGGVLGGFTTKERFIADWSGEVMTGKTSLYDMGAREYRCNKEEDGNIQYLDENNQWVEIFQISEKGLDLKYQINARDVSFIDAVEVSFEVTRGNLRPAISGLLTNKDKIGEVIKMLSPEEKRKAEIAKKVIQRATELIKKEEVEIYNDDERTYREAIKKAQEELSSDIASN